jgi:hypothetical protein
MYDNLIGKEYKGIVATEELLIKSANRLAGLKRSYLEKKKNPDYKLTNETIIKKYNITDEKILAGITSVGHLIDPNNPATIPKPEVKFDDVRDMDLTIDEFAGFRDSERKFINWRLPDYERDYDLTKAADKFKALRAVICEMKIRQLEVVLASKQKGDAEIQKQIDNLDKQYTQHCDSLNALKKQQDNKKDKPDTAGGISEAVNRMSKPIKELQKEAAELKAKKEQFLKDRKKRK